jgi:hypothetical protein
MIINASKYMPIFKCKKLLADYLIYEKNLSLLNVDKKYYYFNDNEILKEILESAPIWVKLLRCF